MYSPGVCTLTEPVQRTFELELEDWEARIFQHEFDHLDGILFIDRMTPADKALAKPKLVDLTREYQESVAHPPRS